MQRHVSRLASTTQPQCWIMDRGYYSWQQLCLLDQYQTHFVFRMPKHIHAIKQFLSGASNDRLIPMTDASAYVKKASLQKHISVRLVKWKQGTTTFVLCTNLFDKNEYPISRLREIYRQRWEVESYYKTLKRTMDLEHCHSSNPELVQQEIWTAMLTTLIARVMEEQNKNPTHASARVNRASAIGLVADLVLQMNRKRKRHHRTRMTRAEQFKVMKQVSQWRIHFQPRFFPRLLKHPVSSFGRNAKTENDIKKFYDLGGISDQSWE